MRYVLHCLCVLMFTVSTASVAQPAAEKPRRPANAVVIDDYVLPMLPKGKSRDDFLRDHKVTTRKTDAETVVEHRLQGRLYKMEVKPASGPSYHLIDEKGDGKFVRMGEIDTKISVPMWVLLTW